MLRVKLPPERLPPSAPVIGLAGGGFFVAWILGVAKEMQVMGVPLRRCAISGASAGAGIAAMLACGVDCAAVLEWILTDEQTSACFRRRGGAVGCISALITRALEHFLPANAAALCSGHVFILMHSESGHYFVSEFATKEKLVHACAASAHVPLFSNGSLFYTQYDDRPHLDGEWRSTRDAVLLCRPGSAMRVLVDHNDDDAISDDHAWWDLATMAVWRTRFRTGRNYAARLAAAGQLPRDAPN